MLGFSFFKYFNNFGERASPYTISIEIKLYKSQDGGRLPLGMATIFRHTFGNGFNFLPSIAKH
jgi:hypothetical protein